MSFSDETCRQASSLEKAAMSQVPSSKAIVKLVRCRAFTLRAAMPENFAQSRSGNLPHYSGCQDACDAHLDIVATKTSKSGSTKTERIIKPVRERQTQCQRPSSEWNDNGKAKYIGEREPA
ncbi:hypothetical protein [Erythrobacter sp. R86502]|uniref:hypothetical protein n=1 Tax=Erythrobacter sp. R86502 TaxID=3093846 RepID=UPI0036D2FC85